jgi:hypothetical protein
LIGSPGCASLSSYISCIWFCNSSIDLLSAILRGNI